MDGRSARVRPGNADVVSMEQRYRPLDEPRMRPSKLRQLVTEGRYEVDARAVAEAIVRGFGRSVRRD